MARYKKILLVDDHGISRHGAGLMLQTGSPDIDVLHASTPDEGRRQVETARPDLIFLDLHFDGDAEGGRRLLKWLKASSEYDAIPVIVMSGEDLRREDVEALIGDGAAGYISKGKTDSADIFRLALMNTEANAVFIHGARPGAAPGVAARISRPMAARDLNLIPSHQRVLVRHIKGMPYKRIAYELDIAEDTVKEHIREMCRKFRVENAKALIYEFARAGVALEDA